MAKVEIYNVGAIGVNRDLPPRYLPPEAWTAALNMRFQDNVAYRMKGHEQVFGTPTVAPGFVLGLPVLSTVYWFYTSLTKAYVYESNVHSNVTRQSTGVDVNYTASAYREWNGCILGGIPILNNGVDLPQYWPTISVSTRLANMTAWPSTMRAKIVRSYGPFLIAFNINDNGTQYPHMLWWSHPADPGTLPASWDYTDPVYDAGRKELIDIEGGEIVDALMLRNLMIVYKQNSTHYLRYVGGQEILGNDQLFAGSGILTARCVASIDRGRKHFVTTADDVITHNGQTMESVLDARARKFLFKDIDGTYYQNSFCMDNPAQREAWFCYPSSGAEYPNKVLIYNYQYGTIQFRDFQGAYATPGNLSTSAAEQWNSLTTTWADVAAPWSEEAQRQVLVASPVDTKLFRLDSTELFDGALITSYLERTGLAVTGRDRQGQPKADFKSRKLCKRIWPKIEGHAPISIQIGAQEDVNDNVLWQPAQIFQPETMKFLDFTANGRFIAVRMEAISSEPWQLEGYDLEIDVLGEH